MAQHLSQTAYQSFNHTGLPGGGSSSFSHGQSNNSSTAVMLANQQQPMYQTMSNFNTNSNAQGGSRIKVAVRIRPLLESERTQGHDSSKLKIQNNNEIMVTNDEASGGPRQKAYRFDQVFHQGTSQADVFSGLGLQNLVTKVTEGYHGTIFAYGQTGSGKTFTMEGYDTASLSQTQTDFKSSPKRNNDQQSMGISQRCIYELYGQLNELRKTERTSGRHYQVFCSFLQIYNEKVFDLLNQTMLSNIGGGQTNNRKVTTAEQMAKQQQGLRIRWTKKDQFVVENLYVFECQTAEEALELFRLGSKNRVLAAHNLNDMSSRSHTIFCMTIESQDIAHQEMVTVSKLQLVDLAGSEKQGLTGTTGQQAKESIDINKSLLVLRKVITALTEQKGTQDNKMNFIPYRESKLTCLLKQSLGGNSYTLMVACLSPSDRYLEENLSTLNYAARAQLISNVPTKNIDPRVMEIDDQKRKIINLEKELRSANQHIEFLTQINDERGKKIQYLEQALARTRENDPCDSNFDSPNNKLPMIKKIDSTSSNNPDLNNRVLESAGNQTIRTIMSPPQKSMNGGATPSSTASQLKRTQMNLQIQSDKQKLDAASERLIHSVNAVSDLLKSNTMLRDEIEKFRRQKDDMEIEFFSLNIENQSLRERLELVEGILKNDRENYEQMVSEKIKNMMQKSNTQYGKFNMSAKLDNQIQQQPSADFTIDAVYTELIQLRQQNRVLETRIKQLELQNFNITRSGFGTSGANSTNKQQSGIKNIEPNRPIFEKPNRELQEGTENEGEEYDDEDEYDEEESHESPATNKQSSFMMRLDQTGQDPQQLVNINPLHSKRNPNTGFQGGASESHPRLGTEGGKSLKSAGGPGGLQARKESQPVPDQRFYTKTNFFTIGGDNNQDSLSIADKYANMHSQKMSRRSDKFSQQQPDFQNSEHDHMQLQQRIQSFTDGMHGQKQEMDYYQQKNRTAGKNKFIIHRPEDQQQQMPSDFDSSGVLVKRKIKTKRPIMPPPLLAGPPPPLHEMMPIQMMPQQQTNNNISMVMVMSNLMTKRKNRKKRTSNSVYQQPSKGPKYQNPEFYF